MKELSSYQVSAPSGSCPYKLTSDPTKEDVYDWVKKVCASGFKSYPYRYFQPAALIYWLKMDVWNREEIGVDVFENTKQWINECYQERLAFPDKARQQPVFKVEEESKSSKTMPVTLKEKTAKRVKPKNIMKLPELPQVKK